MGQLDVRHLDWHAVYRAHAHRTVPQADARAAQCFDHGVADTEVRAWIEYPIGLVELIEGARIRIRQAHRAGDDGCQHRLELER